jgi:hypothetical protein
VVWIQALVGVGRRAEAERKAEQFRRLYPRSMLLPTVESALGGSR